MALYDPATIALIASVGSAVTTGVTGFASAAGQAASAGTQTRAAEEDARRRIRDLKEEAAADAGAIRAALATSGGTPGAEAALQASTARAAARGIGRERVNLGFRSGILSAERGSAQTTGVLSLLGGSLGAAGAVFKR